MRNRLIAVAVSVAAVVVLAANTADREPYQSGPFGGAVTQILSPEEDSPGFDCHVHGNRVCGRNVGQ